MAYNLSKILSKDAVNRVESYVKDGKDAISFMGHKNNSNINEIVSYFQALANPEFVNARETWGNKLSSAPYETLEGLESYSNGKHNSFALKFRSNNAFNVRFPLANNFYDIDGSFKSENCENAENILQVLQNLLNFKLYFKDNKNELVRTKEGAVKKAINIIKNPIKVLTAKEYENKFKTAETGGLTTTKLLVSNTCNGEKLSKAEQIMAVLDYYSKKVNKQVAKKLYKTHNAVDGGKIILGAELLTDIFLSYAYNLGEENNKQIDNALRLQLSNVIASLKNEESINAISNIAHRSVSVLFKKLNLKAENIALMRGLIGTSYINKPENLYEMMFGETKNSAYVKKGEDLFYDGKSPYFEQISKNLKTENNSFADVKTEEKTQEPSIIETKNDVPETITKQTAPTDDMQDILDATNSIIKDEDLFEGIEPENTPNSASVEDEKEEKDSTKEIQEPIILEGVKDENKEEIEEVESTPNLDNITQQPKQENVQKSYTESKQGNTKTTITIESDNKPTEYKLKSLLIEDEPKKEIVNSTRKIEDYLNIDGSVDLADNYERSFKNIDIFVENAENYEKRIKFEDFEARLNAKINNVKTTELEKTQVSLNKVETQRPQPKPTPIKVNNSQKKLSDFKSESQTILTDFNIVSGKKIEIQKKLSEFNDKIVIQKKLNEFDKIKEQRTLEEFNDEVKVQKTLDEFNDFIPKSENITNKEYNQLINDLFAINNNKNINVYVGNNIQIGNNNTINEKEVLTGKFVQKIKEMPINERKEFLKKFAMRKQFKEGQEKLVNFGGQTIEPEKKELLKNLKEFANNNNPQKEIFDFNDSKIKTDIQNQNKLLVESTGESQSPSVPNVFYDNSNVILCGPAIMENSKKVKPETDTDTDTNSGDEGQELKATEPNMEVEFEFNRITTRKPHANRPKRKFATLKRENDKQEEETESNLPKQTFTEEQNQIILKMQQTNIMEKRVALKTFENAKKNICPKTSQKIKKEEEQKYKEKKQLKFARNQKNVFVDKSYQAKKLYQKTPERKMYK